MPQCPLFYSFSHPLFTDPTSPSFPHLPALSSPFPPRFPSPHLLSFLGHPCFRVPGTSSDPRCGASAHTWLHTPSYCFMPLPPPHVCVSTITAAVYPLLRKPCHFQQLENYAQHNNRFVFLRFFCCLSLICSLSGEDLGPTLKIRRPLSKHMKGYRRPPSQDLFRILSVTGELQ